MLKLTGRGRDCKPPGSRYLVFRDSPGRRRSWRRSTQSLGSAFALGIWGASRGSPTSVAAPSREGQLVLTKPAFVIWKNSHPQPEAQHQ